MNAYHVNLHQIMKESGEWDKWFMIDTHTHTHTHTYTHTHTHTYIHYIHTYTHTHDAEYMPSILHLSTPQEWTDRFRHRRGIDMK